MNRSENSARNKTSHHSTTNSNTNSHQSVKTAQSSRTSSAGSNGLLAPDHPSANKKDLEPGVNAACNSYSLDPQKFNFNRLSILLKAVVDGHKVTEIEHYVQIGLDEADARCRKLSIELGITEQKIERVNRIAEDAKTQADLAEKELAAQTLIVTGTKDTMKGMKEKIDALEISKAYYKSRHDQLEADNKEMRRRLYKE